MDRNDNLYLRVRFTMHRAMTSLYWVEFWALHYIGPPEYDMFSKQVKILQL